MSKFITKVNASGTDYDIAPNKISYGTTPTVSPISVKVLTLTDITNGVTTTESYNIVVAETELI